MGVCLLIYQYIHFELSYDRFHPKAESTYRISLDHYRNGEHTSSQISAPYALGPSAESIIPEIQNMVRIRPIFQDEGIVIENPDKQKIFIEYDVFYVEDTFFEMFDYPLTDGDPSTALNEQNNIVLTERMAQKYFGENNPVGKSLNLKGGNLTGTFTITGVLAPLPENTHLKFDFLVPLDFMLTHYGTYKRDNGWGWYNFVTYVNLNQEASSDHVGRTIEKIILDNSGEYLEQENLETKIDLQALPDIHLKSTSSGQTGGTENVWFYAVIGGFILIIAWVNFINLSTSLAINRAKEVGIRKSFGVARSQLISQFLFEAILINTIGAVMAIGIAYLLLPILSELIGKEIAFSVLQSSVFWAVSIPALLLGAILSGLYPAFILSGYKPINALKSTGLKSNGGISLRRGLVTFQFLLSILLITGSYLFYKQIYYMKTKDLGVAMEKIVVVPGPRVILEEGREKLSQTYAVFKSNITKLHTIASITGTSNVPGKDVLWTGDMRKQGAPVDAAKKGNTILVDHNFTNTYDFDFLAGSGFTPEMPEYSGIIINERAVENFNLGTPEEAIGQSIIMSGVDTLRIHGVAKNMHWSSLKEHLLPTVFLINQYNAFFSVKIDLSNIPVTLKHIEATYRESFPNDPFEFYFLDDSFNRQYQSEIQFGQLFSAFTTIGIFIACIGLFALVSFSATLRNKEIGIRKVLGAKVKNIMLLLSKEYAALLLIASLLALPMIILGSRLWLENYAFRTSIGVDLFIIPVLILIALSFITVGYRTFVAAKTNPTDTLRNE